MLKITIAFLRHSHQHLALTIQVTEARVLWGFGCRRAAGLQGFWPTGSIARGAALLAGCSEPGGSWHSDHRRRKRAREEERLVCTRPRLLTLRSDSCAYTLGQSNYYVFTTLSAGLGKDCVWTLWIPSFTRILQEPANSLALPKAPWFLQDYTHIR